MRIWEEMKDNLSQIFGFISLKIRKSPASRREPR